MKELKKIEKEKYSIENIKKLENEVFILINNYHNYFISNKGRIWNSNTNKIIEGTIDRDGYVKVILYKNNKLKRFSIHKLVASHFINNPENKTEVNHLGKKTENSDDKIEWCTPQENKIHAAKNIIKHYVESIQQIDENNKIRNTYSPIKDAKKDGYSIPNIYKALKSKKKYRGFYWKYTNEKNNENIEKEKWYNLKDSIYKELNCFDTYQVSDYGRIKGNNKILKYQYNMQLSHNNIKSPFKYHRLIIMGCNVENPENKPEVDHIDSNWRNNKLINLRWATSKENHNNTETLKKISKPKLDQRYKIEVTSVSNNEIQIYQGLKDLSKKFGTTSTTINKYSLLNLPYNGYYFKIIKN